MKISDKEILKNILKLLKERNKSQKSLCDFLGLKQQAFTNWKNGNNNSFRRYLLEICDFFNCSVNELLGIYDTQKNNKEGILYDKISMLDDMDKIKAEAYVDGMLSAEKYKIAKRA